MSLVGRPVLIKSGDFVGRVGLVTEFTMGHYMVEMGPWKTLVPESQLEPYYNHREIAAVYVTEVGDGGESGDEMEYPDGETRLEELVRPFGYSSDDLANFTEELIHKSVSRIRGVGNQQYSQGDYQKFEAMDIDDLFEYVNEEIFDIVNYAAMLFIRLERLRRGFKLGDGDDVEDEGDDQEEMAE